MVCASPAPAPRRRWHRQFLALLPQIVTHAKIAWRHVRGQDRQDKIQETVANALVAFRRLVQLNKVDLAYPSVLARYAVAQIRDGRLVGSRMNVKDVSSPYCQRVKNVVMERLDRYDPEEDSWTEVVVEDKTAGPDEIARTRIDFADWLASLSAVIAESPSSLLKARRPRRQPQNSASAKAGCRSSAANWPPTGVPLSAMTPALPPRIVRPVLSSWPPCSSAGRAARLSWSFL